MAETFMFYSFFMNIILPFIFVFVLTYALMEKAQLLNNKQAHLLVALAMAFFFIGIPSLIDITSVVIPVVSILVVIAFCLLLIFGILGIQLPNVNNKYTAGLAILLIVIGIIVVLSMVGVFEGISGKLASFFKPEVIQLIAFIVIAAGVAVWIIKSGGGGGGGNKG